MRNKKKSVIVMRIVDSDSSLISASNNYIVTGLMSNDGMKLPLSEDGNCTHSNGRNQAVGA